MLGGVTEVFGENQATILVVDDNPMNIYVLKELLKIDSIKCDEALAGIAALDLVKKRME